MTGIPLLRRIIPCVLFLGIGSNAFAAESTPPLGFWMTPDSDGIVEIYACGRAFCGRFAWLKEDSAEKPSLDDKNPDPALRQRPLCGLTFMGDFRAEDGLYRDGWIYSPRHGGRFDAQLRLLDPDRMELHGYMFLPVLGQSQVWRRVPKPEPCQGSQRTLK